MNIGIIGGTGQMGRWFKRFFEKQGYEVLISGRKTKLTGKDLAKKCDVVIVSVPISKTVDVIKEVGKFVKKDGLLMDFTSVKNAPVKAMLKYSNSQVVGCHPVFGPTVTSLKGQSVILCKGRGVKWFKWLKEVFNKSGAKVKVTTPEKHDKVMALVQGLLHFNSIAFCHTMKELGVDLDETLEYASPIYRLRLNVIGRILNQDPKLYADIQMSNPHIVGFVRTYIASEKKLFNSILRKDKGSFVKYFEETSSYLGKFKHRAQKESDSVIGEMVRNIFK